MDIIKIGKIISENRKRKGITQEELANHMGVSKPAVSKWESGQCYPDIILLPVLAAYFNISVDELIGYEPQMTKEDVRKLYQRLAYDFAKRPFELVFAECEEFLKKYYSCWYLQFKLALLYVNHSGLGGNSKLNIDILNRAISIFDRLEKTCEDINLVKQSVQLKAFCYLSLNQPIEAIELLEGLCEPQMQSETLLAKAYQMKGDKAKAIAYIQGFTFVNLSNLLSVAADFFVLYADQPAKMDNYYHIFMELGDLFEIKKLNPSALYTMYLTAATIYVMQDRKTEAISAIEKYVNLAIQQEQSKFELHGSTSLDELDQYLQLVDIETSAPRNSEVIWKDIKNVILSNPAFQVLGGEPRFEHLKRKLEELKVK